MSSGSVTSVEKRHLWMYLQALGFDPGLATVASGKIVSHTHLGVNMFDKLNRDAFQIVSYFLFQTLDESLTKQVFKFCWPPFDQKSDAEFRKHCCEWLKTISAECGGSFPQVVGSLFLSPGGPKFIHLMYHFARFVAVKYIEANSKNSSLHCTETFNVKQHDMYKCLARYHVAHNRFLQILQRQNYVIQKYQENAQLAIKQVRNLRPECMGLQNQMKKMEPYGDQINIHEKIQKVRSLWTSVNETFMLLEKEREVVSSVLGLVNHYALDGTDVVINIPRLLLDKIEKQMGQLHIGNVYEAGKLNLLTVIQLLNEVLKVMNYERHQADQERLTIDLHYLEKETKFQRERLSDLKHMRYKIKEDLTDIRHSITEKEREWHKKWEESLGLSPFSLIKGCTPAVNLLPPMSPLSFDPVSEEVYEKSILSQYPASLPDINKQHNQENSCRRDIEPLGAVCDLGRNSTASFLLQPISSPDRSSAKDITMRTPKEKNKTLSKKIPEFQLEASSVSDSTKNIDNSSSEGSLPVKKSDPFQKEQDHLVEEVARIVLSDSPQVSEIKEIKLEELIDSLASNPFLTRNQIPRTPENLTNEIRSSWRKAIEVEDNRSTQPIQMDNELREVLSDSSPASCNQREFSMAIFFSDFDQSRFPEEEVVSDSPRNMPQKHVGTSPIGEPSTDQSDLLNKKIICKQDLEHAAVPLKLSEASQTETFSPIVGSRETETFSPFVGSRIDRMDGSKGEHIKILDHSQASYNEPSLHKTMPWNSFQISSQINSKSLKDMDYSILNETLPEVGHLSLNSSRSSELNFKLEVDSPVFSGILPDDMGKRQSTSESDFNLQAIQSNFEALKKSLSKIREDSYLSETLERHKLELFPISKDIQADNRLNSLATLSPETFSGGAKVEDHSTI
ncbi:HAUS augmin-like complex subunit 6 [Perognathus longimembris pacificus]|uniref:HAUS augmin-like complex subunit 6 n=1 Tax=Perognathus longimembris pacificus TaxID=214514 RepID=UPI002019AFF9|nr:HAUS augmin-like complex subunit 6 [Perognathus longimembris pacificus]